MLTREQLTDMIVRAIEPSAERCFARDGTCLSMLFVTSQDGVLQIMVCPQLGDPTCHPAIRTYLDAMVRAGARMVAFVAEIWFDKAQAVAPWLAMGRTFESWADRQEAVAIMAASPAGIVGRCRRVVRQPGQPPRLAPAEALRLALLDNVLVGLPWPKEG